MTEIAGGPLALHPAPRIPAVLSGGGFGPEASLAALIVSLFASAALLWWAWKLGRFVAADVQEPVRAPRAISYDAPESSSPLGKKAW